MSRIFEGTRVRIGAVVAIVSVIAAIVAAPPASAGTGAHLTIGPTSHNYGSVIAGSSTPSFTFTVTNTATAQTSGAVSVSKSGTNAAEFLVTGGSCLQSGPVTVTIAPGGTCTVNVLFHPSASASGARSAKLNVSATPGGTASASLTGTATNAQLAISPTSANFGSVPASGSSAPQSFIVSNTGTTNSGVLSWSVTGANATEFPSGSTDCFALIPAATCTITTSFTPSSSASGNRSAKLTVSASPGGSASASLAGTATSALVITPTVYSFGNVAVNSGSSTSTLTVTNTGSVTSGPFTPTISGGDTSQFTIVPGGTCVNGATLAASLTCTVSVRFDPSSGGNKHTSLRVSASPGGTASSALSGTGTIAHLVISPGSYNFGNVPNGTGPTPAITFTITNTGTAGTTPPLVILKTGTNAAEFSVSTLFPGGCFGYLFGPLPPGGSCQISVTFSPGSPVGKKSATVNVSAGAGEGTPHAGLSGTSTAPALLVLDPTDGNFHLVIFSSPSNPITFTIVNNGYATSGVLSVVVSGPDLTDFTVGNDTCSGNSVAVFAYCTFEVTFTPSSVFVPESASVKVSTPNPAEGLPTALLEGLGTL